MKKKNKMSKTSNKRSVIILLSLCRGPWRPMMTKMLDFVYKLLVFKKYNIKHLKNNNMKK